VDVGEKVRFSATLSEARGEGGRWLEVPFDAKARFGEARAPVRGTLNGTEFHGRLAVYGGATYLGLRKEVRDAAGLDVGDRVEVVLERDDEPRTVDVPGELAAALAGDETASRAFDALSYTHRREYARWVGEAKREPTRIARAAKALVMLRDGTRHP
jgi:bifunctional DNA-binding transcriptional regulator/antitoxin component of YhaV-PrlF toxin-antitoxin module